MLSSRNRASFPHSATCYLFGIIYNMVVRILHLQSTRHLIPLHRKIPLYLHLFFFSPLHSLWSAGTSCNFIIGSQASQSPTRPHSNLLVVKFLHSRTATGRHKFYYRTLRETQVSNPPSIQPLFLSLSSPLLPSALLSLSPLSPSFAVHPLKHSTATLVTKTKRRSRTYLHVPALARFFIHPS